MLLVIQLAYVWLVTFLGTQRIGESKYIVNLGTAFKVFLLLGIGAVACLSAAVGGVTASYFLKKNEKIASKYTICVALIHALMYVLIYIIY